MFVLPKTKPFVIFASYFYSYLKKLNQIITKFPFNLFIPKITHISNYGQKNFLSKELQRQTKEEFSRITSKKQRKQTNKQIR